MSTLQVKNVPGPLHARLTAHLAKTGETLREFLLRSLDHELAQAAFEDLLDQHAPVELRDVSVRELLERERADAP
jgi:hypothetical protein